MPAVDKIAKDRKWKLVTFTKAACPVTRVTILDDGKPYEQCALWREKVLAEIAKLASEARLPPVAHWNPAHCGDSEMRIARDGTWFHQGSPIGRPAMVKLFSTILRREADGSFVLVTPVEKLDIEPGVAQKRHLGVGLDDGVVVAVRMNERDAMLLAC